MRPVRPRVQRVVSGCGPPEVTYRVCHEFLVVRVELVDERLRGLEGRDLVFYEMCSVLDGFLGWYNKRTLSRLPWRSKICMPGLVRVARSGVVSFAYRKVTWIILIILAPYELALAGASSA